MVDTPRNPEHYAYESDFEQHRAWEGMSHDEKLESLWFGQLAFVRKADGHTARLNDLNGGVRKTMKDLADYKVLNDTRAAEQLRNHELEMAAHARIHREEIAGITFIKIWGARGTALVLTAVSVLGGIYYITQIVRALGG